MLEATKSYDERLSILDKYCKDLSMHIGSRLILHDNTKWIEFDALVEQHVAASNSSFER